MKKSDRYKKTVVVLAVLTLLVYIIWRIFFTLPIKYGTLVVICGIVMLVCEVISAIETIMHLVHSIHLEEPELPVIPDEWYPDVDVFIATHNEPLDVLYKTANGCTHMKYPDKNKVHIWFCDDGNRESVKKLAEEMGIGYHGLANNKLAKAGNLNNALSKTSGELVATFDADMIPTRNFLIKTVPYFFLPKMKKTESGEWVERQPEEIDPNYKIGFIQTPQSFYNPDLFQYNLYSENSVPNEQDYFFREINVSRNKANAPIYAGSNTLISREALELVGGIATGTITEDFETGIHIQDEGYTCYATSEVLAHGLSPDTIDSLVKQRERWGRGCIYSLRRINIWKDKKMPFRAKMSYFSCELYWWSYLRRFVFTLAPIIFMLFHVPVIVCKPWQMFLIWLPSYLMGLIAARAVSSEIRNTRWSNIVDTVLFPYLVIPILLEALGVRKREFHVTEKRRAVNNESDAIMALPHLILSLLSLIAIVRAVGQMIEYESIGPVIILYWLIVNLSSLVMSVFFMLGRTNKRLTERYRVAIPVCLGMQEKVYAETVDVSEDGMSVFLKKPMDIPMSKPIDIMIHTHHYKAMMKAQIVHVETYQDGWKYCFHITELDENNKKEYFQIVYDREPSLPDKLDENASVFGDFRNNLKERGRKAGVKEERRRTFRIPLNRYMKTENGKNVFVEDYNFRYVLLNPETEQEGLPQEVKIYPDEENKGLCFEAVRKRILKSGKQLYYIKNHNEIAFQEDMEQLTTLWLNEAGLE
ncbi:MAG: glycosyltransferase family 2 protein [Roseburia sp.]